MSSFLSEFQKSLDSLNQFNTDLNEAITKDKQDKDDFLSYVNTELTQVNGKIKNLDIEHYLKYYGGNAKCVISHKLFLNNKMRSIRNNKFVQSKIEEVLKNQS